ncbi:MAG TPA: hypothetical protein VHN20_19900 [Beijerinckiaceae bacterium]|nr:hypothetical protein [Beijerinckiaceae bacterium]
MIAYVVDNLGPWNWIILGLVLMGLELVRPGYLFFWLGSSAVLTGLLGWLFGSPWQAQVLMFVLLAVVDVVLWRMTRRRKLARCGAE